MKGPTKPIPRAKYEHHADSVPKGAPTHPNTNGAEVARRAQNKRRRGY